MPTYNPPGSPLEYPINDEIPIRIYRYPRAPTSQDWRDFRIRDFWIDSSRNELWFLVAKNGPTPNVATWILLGAGATDIEFLEGNTGGPVGPDPSQIIFTIGSSPIVVTGNPVTNTLTWGTDGTLATQYDADVGSAIAALGILNLFGGTGINTVAAGNTVTFNAFGMGFTWIEIAIDTQGLVNTGYVTNSLSLVTLTLPQIANFGDAIAIVGKGAGGWRIAQNAGQTIHFLNNSTTTGAGGSLSSTGDHDTCFLLCTTQDTDWTAIAPGGSITIT